MTKKAQALLKAMSIQVEHLSGATKLTLSHEEYSERMKAEIVRDYAIQAGYNWQGITSAAIWLDCYKEIVNAYPGAHNVNEWVKILMGGLNHEE